MRVPEDVSRKSVLVDWCSVVFPGTAVGPQGDFLGRVRRLFDGTVTEFRSRAGGLHGYRYSIASDAGGVLIAWGGNADTVFLQLPGDACARVDDWHVFRAFIESHAGHLTRVDLAFDDLDGEHSVDQAVELYQAGLFGFRQGRPPRVSQAGNWITPDGHGRTLYVGRSANGKMLRCYEKGRQLGDPASPWVRWEVQFANRDRELPIDMLTDPAPYLRAAYPALAFVPAEGMTRIATRRAQERISVEKLTRHAREGYGQLFDHLVRSGIDAVELVERVRRDGLPQRLLAPTAAELEERCNALVSQLVGEELDALRND